MLLAFIALIALLNMLIGSLASLFGYDHITIEWMLGYIFAPIAYIIGVPANEMLQAGSLLVKKLLLMNFLLT